MNHRIVLRGIFAFGLGLLLSAAVQAQAFRTYLSSGGSDANPCSLAAPCRLLPAAIAAVIDGGEVWMLDSANYNSGPVNVNKSVTILAVPGALGSVVALGGNAIDIATAGVKVALRNLVIVPFVGGPSVDSGGINMTAGASLTVAECLIANLPGDGIYVSANNASVLVTDTVIRGNRNNGLTVADGARATVTRATVSGNGFAGVVAQGNLAGAITTADVDDSTMDSNQFGVVSNSINASAQVRVSVRNSQIVRTSEYGLLAQSNTSGLATLSASNNIVSNNKYGLAAIRTGAKVWASGNTVSENVTGLYINLAGVIETAGNNAVRNNGTATSGAITGIAPM